MLKGNVFTIHPGQNFASIVAQHVLSTYGNNPLDLADVTIYVPSPRVVRTLKDAFNNLTGDGSLLPRISPLSPDEETSDFVHFTHELSQTENLQIASNLSRLMLFMRQIRAKEPNITPARALESASSLAKLADKMTTHGISFDKVSNIIPPELASHWQENLNFLNIAFQFYPEWLQEQNKTDLAQQTRDTLLKQAEIYQNQGLSKPVIAAGFSDTTPAGLKLIRSILTNEFGTLILPGLDVQNVYESEYKENHPQYGMQHIVKTLDITKDDVKCLGYQEISENAQLWWHSLKQLPKPQEIKPDFTLIEAENIQQEAEAIAILLRKTVEDNTKNAALVTPNRNLAKRVVAVLRQWDIEADDSAGVPLTQTSEGRLVTLMLEIVTSNFRPLKLAELIKHPNVRFSLASGVWKEAAYTLENRVLRKRFTQPKIATYKQEIEQQISVQNANESDVGDTALHHALKALESIENTFANWRGNYSDHMPLEKWINLHLATLNAITKTSDDTASSFLNSDAGDSLMSLFETWLESEQETGLLSLKDYQNSLQFLLEKVTIRRSFNLNKNINIWGPLEARLQNADLVIIGGANEGVWPKDPSPDPWLGRSVMAELGLPSPDMAVGLNGHDFISLASGNNVVISRTVKDSGSETIPSRFLSRLKMIIGEQNYDDLLKRGQQYIQLSNTLRRHGKISKTQLISVCPKTEFRPQIWSASFVKDLMNCPYKSYVQKTLGIRKLDLFEQPADASERGQLFHLIFHAFFDQQPNLPAPYKGGYGSDSRQNMLDTLLHIADVAFDTETNSNAKAVWWPRFTEMAESFVDQLVTDNKQGRQPFVREHKAEYQLPQGIKLHARADRVDINTDGGIILDYKTGQKPTQKAVESGKEPQMAVEGFLADKGGYPTNKPLSGLEVWQFKASGDEALSIIKLRNIEGIVENASAGLNKLADHFNDPNTVYEPIPADNSGQKKEKHCTFCDYAGICRFQDTGGNNA